MTARRFTILTIKTGIAMTAFGFAMSFVAPFIDGLVVEFKENKRS